ncbi:MAG: hypothetical protein U0325_24960 [Polyangiales bacterium]
MRRWTMFSTLAAVLVAPVTARAQCVVEGLTAVDALGTAPLRQAMRVTLAGPTATLEGSAPLVFHREVPASQVRLYLAAPFLWGGVLAASRGTPVTVEQRDARGVTATLRVGDALVAHGVAVPCGSLTPQGSTPTTPEGLPAAAPTRWVTRSGVVYAARCAEGRGSAACAQEVSPASRCRLRDDASQCGYHPVGPRLRVFAEPRADSASVALRANRDVVFADEDGRPGWLLVRTRGLVSGLAARGWVRTQDVRWAQEVPPSVRRPVGVRSQPGRRVQASARRGAVTLTSGTVVVDPAGHELARVGAAPFCTRAELPLGAARAIIALPGMTEVDEGAQVDAARLAWVDACPTTP